MKMKKQLYFPLLITLLASLIFGVLPLGQPSTVYAAPDTENLWSESNSVSDPAQLTLTSSTDADGSTTGTWADASGKWAKTPYEWWEFVMENHTLGQGTINSVTLYLKHRQSGWANDNFNIDVFDGSTWNTVRAYVDGDGPPTTDTTDNWSVAVIDTWAKVDAAQVRIIGNGSSGGEDTVDWFVDTVELRVDYTLPPPDISNSPSDYAFGLLAEGATANTTLTYFTVTNYSGYDVNITIGGTDMIGGVTWELSDTATPGEDTYGLKAGLAGTSYNITVPKTFANPLVNNLTDSSSRQWGLQLLAPTSFSDGGSKSGTVTLTATQA